MKTFSQKIGLIIEKKLSENLMEEVKEKLLFYTKKFLFIFDNLDESHKEIAKGYIKSFSEQKNFYILITTTNFNTNDVNNPLVIRPKRLDLNECIDFIKLSFNEIKDNKKTINKMLQIFNINQTVSPLILRILIAFIKNKIGYVNTLENFLATLQNNKDNLKIDNVDNRLFSLIINEHQEAWNLVKHLIFLDPDFIPFDILTDLLKFDTKKLDNSIEILIKLSFISYEIKNNIKGLKIHRVLQNKTREFILDQDILEINLLLENLKNSMILFFKSKYRHENEQLHLKYTNNETINIYYYQFKRIIDEIVYADEFNYDFVDDCYLEKALLAEEFADYFKENSLISSQTDLYYSISGNFLQKILARETFTEKKRTIVEKQLAIIRKKENVSTNIQVADLKEELDNLDEIAKLYDQVGNSYFASEKSFYLKTKYDIIIHDHEFNKVTNLLFHE